MAKPLGYSKITALTTIKQLADGTLGKVPQHTVNAIITVQGGSIVYRDDNGVLDSSNGMPLGDGDVIEYSGNFDSIRFLETVPTAILHVSFYGD